MKLRRQAQKRLILVSALLVFVLLGIYLLQNSRAATPFTQAEAEGGVGSCVTNVADTTASGSSAVRFGGCASSTDPNSPLSLDATGGKIPDTNYAIPAGALFVAPNGLDTNPGTQAAPFKTVTKAINTVPSGGTVVFRAGTYHDGYRSSTGTTYGIANKTMTLQAYPHEQVWFDGTDVQVATSWTADGAGRYYKAWDTPSFCENKYYNFKYNAQPTTNTGPCSHFDMYGDPSNPAAGDPQMVFIDGKYVHEVLTLAEVTPGSNNFFYDWGLKRIYIATAPTGHTVELAARPTFLVMGGTAAVNVKILGLGFKKYATNEYENQTAGAVVIYGDGVTVENSVFTQMAGRALFVSARRSVVRHTAIMSNGYNAIGSNGHSTGDDLPDGLLMENNLISNNGTEKFGTGCTASCGQAGVKLGHMIGYTFKGNIVTKNQGWGVWCDLACVNGVMVNNYFADNSRGGSVYEVSSKGIIASNVYVNNYHAQIQVASPTTKVYNNTIIGGATDYAASIWVYDDPRYIGKSAAWTANEVGPDTTGVEMANNVISSGIRSVFVQGIDTTGTNTVPSQFFTKYDFNSYHRTAGTAQALLGWRPPTGTVTYTSLPNIRTALGFETNGIDVAGGADPFFVDLAGGNYNIRSTSTAAYRNGTALPADVAAAIGVPASAGQNRGALIWPGKP